MIHSFSWCWPSRTKTEHIAGQVELTLSGLKYIKGVYCAQNLCSVVPAPASPGLGNSQKDTGNIHLTDFLFFKRKFAILTIPKCIIQ